MCTDNRPEQLLGSVLYSATLHDFTIANCFAQTNCGSGLQTNYEALTKCMQSIKEYALNHNINRVAIPGLIGCGLAGGDWNIVRDEIIVPIFQNSDIELIIAYFNKSDFDTYCK